MNFFILYVSLPALFFRILSQDAVRAAGADQLRQGDGAGDGRGLLLAFMNRPDPRAAGSADATLAGVAGGFGNVGYMGPGLALATLGPEAAVPVALIFCFDALLIFTLMPLLMAFSGASKVGFGRALLDVVRSIVLNPLLIAAAIGVAARRPYHIEPPVAVDRLLEFLYTSAAPCALFALGVTVALRPMQRMSRPRCRCSSA